MLGLSTFVRVKSVDPKSLLSACVSCEAFWLQLGLLLQFCQRPHFLEPPLSGFLDSGRSSGEASKTVYVEYDVMGMMILSYMFNIMMQIESHGYMIYELL